MTPFDAVVGFLSGSLLTLAVVWVPARSRWREAAENLREMRRLTAPYRLDTGEQPTVTLKHGQIASGDPLKDAEGAFAAAQAAYMPVYPGNQVQPDETWLAYIHEGGRSYDGGHQPRHLATEVDSTPDLTQYPVWGEQPRPPAPWVVWTWSTWLLALIAAPVLAWPPRRRYPLWRRALDRAWEAGVVFEVSGQRVNAWLGALPGRIGWTLVHAGTRVFVLELTALLVLAWAQVVGFGADLWLSLRRQGVGPRAKRHYPIKQG